MATEIERLAVLIEANTKSYETAMRRMQAQTEKAIRGSSRAVEAMSGRLDRLGAVASKAAGLLRFTIGIAGVTTLGRGIRDTVRAAGDLVDTANKIGISTDALQELRFAAEQSGESAETLDLVMAMFTKRLGDAGQGSGELNDLLKLNGVALRDQAGEMRPVSALLADVADLIAHATSAQDKMNVAVAAFGKGGGGAVNIFARGAAGIRDFANEAQKAGVVIDDKLLKKAAEIDDAWQKMTMRVGMAWRSMILGAASEVDYLLDLSRSTDSRSTEAIQRQVTTAMSARKAVLASALAPFSDTYIASLDAEIAPLMEELRKRANLNMRGELLGMQKPVDPFNPTIIPKTGNGGGSPLGDAFDVRPVDDYSDHLAAMNDQFASINDTAQAFASTMLHGLLDGQSAAESFASALDQIASKLLDSGINLLFGGGAGGGGGVFSTLLSALGFGKGGGGLPGGSHQSLTDHAPMLKLAGGGFVPAGRLAMVGEEGPEIIRAGRGGNTVYPTGRGGMTIKLSTHIDARGSGRGVAEELRSELDRRDARVRAELPGLVDRARKNRVSKIR